MKKLLLSFYCLFVFSLEIHAQNLFVSTYTGGTVVKIPPGGGTSTTFASGLIAPMGVAFDTAGYLYVTRSSVYPETIQKFAPDGTMTIFYTCPTTYGPWGLAFNSNGDLYVSSEGTDIVWKLTPDAEESTVLSAGLDQPQGLAFDGSGNLYIANSLSGLIIKMTPDGTPSIFATVTDVMGLACDAAGNVYAASSRPGKIMKISPDGTSVTTFASGLNEPYGLTFDLQGNLYEADSGSGKILKFSPVGVSLGIYASGITSPHFLAFEPPTNVKSFGAKGTAQHVMDGVMISGSNQLTSATANFTGAKGMPISVLGAATQTFAGVNGGNPVAGANLVTTISTVVDQHTVLLAAPAAASVTAASVIWGPDDTAAIRTAINSVGSTGSGGGVLYFPPGLYWVNVNTPLTIGYSNVHLTGAGQGNTGIINSYVALQALEKSDGSAYYINQLGIPCLYVGSATTTISNVTIDNLTFQDNGQGFNYDYWVAVLGSVVTSSNWVGGSGVIGASSTLGVNNLTFHDLTIKTNSLCGINVYTNSMARSNGINIYNCTISGSGNHGMYLCAVQNLNVHDNTIQGSSTAPTMREGLVMKGISTGMIQHNDISYVSQQCVGCDGNTTADVCTNVSITLNTIHDCNPMLYGSPTVPINTYAIQSGNSSGLQIIGNSIININAGAILLGVSNFSVNQSTISDNHLDNVNYAIAASASTGSGVVTGITIADNDIINTPKGTRLYNVGGTNSITGNSIVAPAATIATNMGYNMDALLPGTTATITVTGNSGQNCTGSGGYYFVNLANQSTVYTDNSLH